MIAFVALAMSGMLWFMGHIVTKGFPPRSPFKILKYGPVAFWVLYFVALHFGHFTVAGFLFFGVIGAMFALLLVAIRLQGKNKTNRT